MFARLVRIEVVGTDGSERPALLRQIGAGSSIAGNIAFKQNTTSVADRGIEAGIAWIIANQYALNTTNAAAGYYSSWDTNADPATWTYWGAGTAGSAADVDHPEDEILFVVRRLCQFPGIGAADAGQYCSDSLLSSSTGNDLSACGYNPCSSIPIPGPFYQITARVLGPRNSLSYTQVLVN